MNNAHEAKQGLITFIATLLITTGVFFAFYTVVNKLNSRVNTEDSKEVSSENNKYQGTNYESNGNEKSTTNNDALGTDAANSNTDTTQGQGAETHGEKPSVFGSLIQKDDNKTLLAMDSTKAQPAVLAGATTNESTGSVPSTGSESIASLILASGLLIFAGTYFGVKKSRVVALKSFEENITKEL